MKELNFIEIGNRIRDKRKEMDLTQKELAVLVNLSEGSVSKYESGKVEDASLAKLYDFANVLDVDLIWLLGTKEETKVDIMAGHLRKVSDEKLKRIENFIKFTLSQDD